MQEALAPLLTAFPPLTRMPDSPLEDLQDQVRRKQVFLVVGAGVSISSTEGNPVTSWPGLLENGVARCESFIKKLPDGWARRAHEEIASGDLSDLLSAAEKIQHRLREAREYPGWLQDIFSNLEVKDPGVLEALKELGLPIATTNYDGLLEDATGLPAVTWQQRPDVERILRGDSPGILHLHGFWRDPSSVVLGIRDYEAIRRDPHAQATLRSIRSQRTMLFVGCGTGLEDPNFSALLGWAREVFGDADKASPYRHYRLARNGDVAELRKAHDAADRIYVLGYGEEYDDLPGFLRSLAAPAATVPTAPTPASPAAHPAPEPIRNTIPPLNPHFSHRDELLEQLRAQLLSGKPAALTQAIAGLGGVGKTQLAVAYVRKYGDGYGVVWWLRAEKAATLDADYAELGKELGIAQTDDVLVMRNLVRNALGKRSDWLLVFDNAPGPDDVREHLPGGGGHALITSRNRHFGQLAQALPVPVWPVEEGADFLLQRTEKTDRATAETISKELGGLPLALEQAGAYVETTGVSLPDYLRLFGEAKLRLFDSEHSPKPDDYPATVNTTWEVSLEQLASVPLAEKVLQIAAFLVPDDISRSLLRKIASPDDELAFNAALAALGRYSFLELGEDSVSVHRLVQEVIRVRLSPQERRACAVLALNAVAEAFPWPEYNKWPVCIELLPHALACIQLVRDFALSSPEAATLMTRVASLHAEQARFAAAEPLYAEALAMAEQVFGVEEALTAITLNDLGALYRELGRYSEAEALIQRAVNIREAELGAEHPYLAISLGNMASLYRELGRPAEAEPLLQRALRINEGAFGPEHPQVAASLNSLASAYRELGRPAEAEPLLQRALRIDEATFGPEHPQVAASLNNLAFVYTALGRPADAEPLYERALRINEDAYGPEHPDVAISLDNLGSVCHDLDRPTEAEPLHQRALRIREAAFGPEHPDVAVSLINLASVYQKFNRPVEAEPLYERALRINEAAFGPEHPLVATSLSNLATLYQELDRLTEAELLYQRALRVREAAFGPEHPAIAVSLNNLGHLYIQIERLGEAERFLRRAIRINESRLGPEHPRVGITCQSLGRLYLRQGRNREARPLLKRAEAIQNKQRLAPSAKPFTPRLRRD